MNRACRKLLMVLSIASFSVLHHAWANSPPATEGKEVRYIHSKIAQLYAKPAFTAEKLALLKYGSKVELLGENKSWANIRVDNDTGWVAKMVLGHAKPLEKTQVSTEESANSRNKARKRASVRASAAATRGLSGNFRQRKDEAQQESNYTSLKKVEEMSVEEKDVLNFNEALKP